MHKNERMQKLKVIQFGSRSEVQAIFRIGFSSKTTRSAAHLDQSPKVGIT